MNVLHHVRQSSISQQCLWNSVGFILALLILLGLSRWVQAANVSIDQVQVPEFDPSYTEGVYGDPGWVTFNYHILAEPVNLLDPVAGGTGALTDVPKAPSGNTDAIRIFTGTGNTGNDFSGSLGFTLPDAFRFDNTNVFDQDGDDGVAPNGDDKEFNLLATENIPAHWYGVDYNGAGNTVDKVMLGSQLLQVIQNINPGTNSPGLSC